VSDHPAILIADAVTARLNEGAEPDHQAARLYRPTHRLEQLTALRIIVVPRSLEMIPDDRAEDRLTVEIDVGVQQKVAPDDAGSVDAVMATVDGLVRKLNRVDLEAGDDYAAFVEIEHRVLYMPDHLDQYQVITSIFTVTYQMMRGES